MFYIAADYRIVECLRQYASKRSAGNRKRYFGNQPGSTAIPGESNIFAK
jgi:hypothetical protein